MGTLNHDSKLVRSGRSFIRRMLDLLHGVPQHPIHPHPIHLNCGFRSDLLWWNTFVKDWNGISFLAPPANLPQKRMASDASGLWGCGAWYGKEWYQVQWDSLLAHLPIMVKELLPIVLVGELRGHTWSNCRIACLCDNKGSMRSGTSWKQHIMHLLRKLAFIEARHSYLHFFQGQPPGR